MNMWTRLMPSLLFLTLLTLILLLMRILSVTIDSAVFQMKIPEKMGRQVGTSSTGITTM